MYFSFGDLTGTGVLAAGWGSQESLCTVPKPSLFDEHDTVTSHQKFATWPSRLFLVT